MAVYFLSKEQTKQFIEQDPDDYFASFTRYDLYARSSVSVDDYKRSIIAKDFPMLAMIRLQQLCARVDGYLPESLRGIPWYLALTDQDTYENGFPHTRGRLIFLSTDSLQQGDGGLTHILVHEKIHVYQRYNRTKVMKQLPLLGFYPFCEAEKIERRRANPDLDPIIYFHADVGPMVAIYTSDRPRSLLDVKLPMNESKYEHPFELMAYELSDSILEIMG